jgi:hypothetical protein
VHSVGVAFPWRSSSANAWVACLPNTPSVPKKSYSCFLKSQQLLTLTKYI